MRRTATVALLLTALAAAGAACSDDELQPVDVGQAPVTTASPAAADDLAIVRCESVPLLSPDPPVEGPLAADPAVAAAQQERAGYGAASDEASTVAALAAGPSPELGFPLTAAEERAFMERQAVSGDVAQRIEEAYGDEPWFAGTWIDNGRGRTGLAVTDDPVGRQEDVDAAFGDAAVLVVPATRSLAELAALQPAVTAFVQANGLAAGSGQDVLRNVVSVQLEVLDPAIVEQLASEVGADGLCVTGTDPADVVPEGPQPEAGEGWRLLADQPGRGEPYATGFAGTPEELDALWARIGLDGEVPAVDFATEVVLWFGPAVSGSCSDIRMDDVVLDGDRVLPVIVLPGGARGCTDDANPHAYVVAYERARLPERFTVSIDPPNESCCPEGTTEVDLGDG